MADTKIEEVPATADAPAVTAEAVDKPVEAQQPGDAVADAQGTCRRAPRLRVACTRRRAARAAARSRQGAAWCYGARTFYQLSSPADARPAAACRAAPAPEAKEEQPAAEKAEDAAGARARARAFCGGLGFRRVPSSRRRALPTRRRADARTSPIARSSAGCGQG
jgi:hypothetical protein